MKREAAEILKDALALPTEAGAALAGLLLESLDTIERCTPFDSRRRCTSSTRSRRSRRPASGPPSETWISSGKD